MKSTQFERKVIQEFAFKGYFDQTLQELLDEGWMISNIRFFETEGEPTGFAVLFRMLPDSDD